MEVQGLRRLWVECHSAWPGVCLSFESFARAIERHRGEVQPFELWSREAHVADLYLATACANAEPAALACLDQSILQSVTSTIGRVDGSSAFLDEVRQELRVHLLVPGSRVEPRIADYSGRGPLVSWLQVCAARLALDAKRRSPLAICDKLEAVEPPLTAAPDIECLKGLYRHDVQQAFHESFRELTPRQRNLLRLHFLEGVSLERLAVMYVTHRTTVGRCVARACQEVRAGTRKRLAARLQLPRGVMDSLVHLLRSRLEFTASLLLSSGVAAS